MKTVDNKSSLPVLADSSLTHDEICLLLGNSIRVLRENYGLSADYSAEVMNISLPMLSQMEHGDISYEVWEYLTAGFLLLERIISVPDIASLGEDYRRLPA